MQIARRLIAMCVALTVVACTGAEPQTQTSAPNPAGDVPVQAPATTAAAPERSYRWHTAEAGESVQYGLPGTDDRLLRIDCGADGRIAIGGRAGVDGPEGAQVFTTFGEGDAARSLPGVLAEADDGMNFYVEVAPDDPALQTLLAGRSLRIVRGEYSWEVPGDGAAAELRRLIEVCGA